jgi:hypothetical protein
VKTRKQTILDVTDDLVGKFLYYDRKECESLARGAIQAAIGAGEITVDEIVKHFESVLREAL